jgi:alkylation response protein AidB-like acyl-CoA dehydrogenase
MEFRFGEKAEQLRQEVREFVQKENLHDEILVQYQEEHSDEQFNFVMDISKKLAEKKWLTLTWPKEHGGLGASVEERLAFFEEVGYWAIPGTGMGVSGTGWVGPSLMLFGSKELQEKHLPLISSGSLDGVWCTGYSEPDSGSDLASLQTTAIREGDEYVINGQKVWTSAAHRARWCWLACRTNPSATKKHHGISLIIVDMKHPGVKVRPIYNLMGFNYFNEIFFTNVRMPVTNLVGEENNGWYHIMKALSFERSVRPIAATGSMRRYMDEMVNYAKQHGLMENPEIRCRLAELASEMRAMRQCVFETIWKESAGLPTPYEYSRDKATNDELTERVCVMGTSLIGAYSQIDQLLKDNRWTRLKGAFEGLYYSSPGMRNAAGTTHTQLNIAGQMGLGLPRPY